MHDRMLHDDDEQAMLMDAYAMGVDAGTLAGFRRGYRMAWAQIEAACIAAGNTDGADFARGILDRAEAQEEANAAAWAGLPLQ